MSKFIKAELEPSHEEIAAYAQSIYEQEGRPEGKAVEHWLQAEAQLTAERKARAAQAPAKAVAKSGSARNSGWQASTPSPNQSQASPN